MLLVETLFFFNVNKYMTKYIVKQSYYIIII